MSRAALARWPPNRACNRRMQNRPQVRPMRSRVLPRRLLLFTWCIETMKLSQFFISRPIFAGVLSALIFLAGLIALPQLPISEYPEVVPPTVIVKANYPGANPKVIAETVASPLEQAINGVEGMLYQSSQATADGVMTLTITFALRPDVDKAQVQVQNRVSQALPKLPDVVQRL